MLSVESKASSISENAELLASVFDSTSSKGKNNGRATCSYLDTLMGVHWTYVGNNKIAALSSFTFKPISYKLITTSDTAREAFVHKCLEYNATHFLAQMDMRSRSSDTPIPRTMLFSRNPLIDSVPALLDQSTAAHHSIGQSRRASLGNVLAAVENRNAQLPIILSNESLSLRILTTVGTFFQRVGITCEVFSTIALAADGTWVSGEGATLENSGSVMLVTRCTVSEMNGTTSVHYTVMADFVGSDVSISFANIYLSETGKVRLLVSCFSSSFSLFGNRPQDGSFTVTDGSSGRFAIIVDIQTGDVRFSSRTNIQSCATQKLAFAQSNLVLRRFVLCTSLVSSLDAASSLLDVQLLLIDLDMMSFGFGAGGFTNRVLRSVQPNVVIDAMDLDLSSSRFVTFAVETPGIVTEVVTAQWPLSIVPSLLSFETPVLSDGTPVAIDEQFVLIGRQEFFETVLSLTVDEVSRTLNLITLRVTEIRAFSLNLFGILDVYPTVIDSAGGGTIFITGNGFPLSSNGQILCETNGVFTNASLVDSTTITCPIRATNLADTACNIEAVVVIFPPNRTTISGAVVLRRPVSAIVVRAVSQSQMTEGYSSALLPSGLILHGYGFVPSPSCACRLIVQRTKQVIFVQPATVSSGDVAFCHQPVAPISSEPTCLQYSHDGFHFGVSCAPFMLLGPLQSLSVMLQGGRSEPVERLIQQVDASSITLIPTFTVFTVDAYQNRRLEFEDSRNLFIRCSTNVPDVSITGQAPELLDFVSNISLTGSVFNGQSRFRIGIRSPKAADVAIFCFLTANVFVQVNFTLRVVPGLPSQLFVRSQETWVVGVTTRRTLTPNPIATLTDAANNIITSTERIPPVAFVRYKLLSNDDVTFTNANLIAFPQSDGTYVFNDVGVRSQFRGDTTLVFGADGVSEISVSLPLESCIYGSEYAVPGTVTCAPCPAFGICDGSSDVQVQDGYWRSDVSAYTFYPCSPSDSCVDAYTCEAGYEGPVCAKCSEGYGWSSNYCAPCASRIVNWLAICGMTVGYMIIIYFLSINTMSITAPTDIQFLTKEKRAELQADPLKLSVKVLVSHFQLLTLIPITRLKMPPWFASFFAVSKNSASSGPNLSFFTCEFGSGSVNEATRTVIMIPILVSVFVFVSFVVALYLRSKLQKSMYQEVEILNNAAIDVKNHYRMVDYISRGDLIHKDQLENNHRELFDFDIDQLKEVSHADILHASTIAQHAAADRRTSPLIHHSSQKYTSTRLEPTSGSEDDLVPNLPQHNPQKVLWTPFGRRGLVEAEVAAVQEKADFLEVEMQRSTANMSCSVLLQRWANMVVASLFGVIFFFYPAVVQTASTVLRCADLDLGGGEVISVVQAEPSTRCDSAEYQVIQTFGFTVVAGFGVGAPLLVFLLIKLMTKVSCDNSPTIARLVFFFTTGCYHERCAYWEAVSLARKTALVLGANLFAEVQLQLLWCMWILSFSVFGNLWMKPWVAPVLTRLETMSFGVLAFSYACCQLITLNYQAHERSRLGAPVSELPDGERSGGDLGSTFNDIVIYAMVAANVSVTLFVFLRTLEQFVERGRKLAAEGNAAMEILFGSAPKNVEKLRREIRKTVLSIRKIRRASFQQLRVEVLLSAIATHGSIAAAPQFEVQSSAHDTRRCELEELIGLLGQRFSFQKTQKSSLLCSRVSHVFFEDFQTLQAKRVRPKPLHSHASDDLNVSDIDGTDVFNAEGSVHSIASPKLVRSMQVSTSNVLFQSFVETSNRQNLCQDTDSNNNAKKNVSKDYCSLCRCLGALLIKENRSSDVFIEFCDTANACDEIHISLEEPSQLPTDPNAVPFSGDSERMKVALKMPDEIETRRARRLDDLYKTGNSLVDLSLFIFKRIAEEQVGESTSCRAEKFEKSQQPLITLRKNNRGKLEFTVARRFSEVKVDPDSLP